MDENANTLPAQDNLRTLTLVIYLLQAAGLVLGITTVIAFFINYLKRDEVKGTIYESHFTWQIRTFWFGMLWMLIGYVTALVLVGYLVVLVTYIWLIYRTTKGLLRLFDGRPMD